MTGKKMDRIHRIRQFIARDGGAIMILAVLIAVPVRIAYELLVGYAKPDAAVVLFTLGFLCIDARLVYELFSRHRPD